MNHDLDLTHIAAEPLGAGRVVIRDSGRRARLPLASGNAPASILGVTTEPQSRVGRSIPVRRAGIVDIATAAAVAPGDMLVIAAGDGSVRPIAMPSVLVPATGGAGGVRLTARQFWPHLEHYIVEIGPASANQQFTLSVASGRLLIQLAANGSGVVTTTAAQLQSAINGSAAGSLFAATVQGNPSATLIAETSLLLTGFVAEGPVIAIAQDAAPGPNTTVSALLVL